MSTELKPCPFCGGETFVHMLGNEIAKGYYIACDECGAKTKVFGYEAEAIKAWNKRAERTVKPKKGAYDLIRCDCGMPVSSNYDFCPKCKAKLDWSVENCQPENGDDFENANRKGNDE